MRFVLIIMFLLVCTSASGSQSTEKKNAPADELNALSYELEILKKELEYLKNEQQMYGEQNRGVQEKLGELNSGLQAIKMESKDELSGLERSINEISFAWRQFSLMTKIGAFILLAGLMIEIIGATVLAGTHLVAEQKPVYTLESTPPQKDLGLRDVVLEPKIDFLGSIASLILFLGFVFQFSGTVLVLSLPWWLTVVMVVLAILPGSWVIYYLLGQSYNQTRLEKLSVVAENIKRNIPRYGVKCSICSRKVKRIDQAKVFWMQEPNSDQYPYLYTPYNMHLGHEACLEACGKYKQPKNRKEELPEIEIHKRGIEDFLLTDAPRLNIWWNEYRAHWLERRGTEEAICYSEYVYKKTLRQASKLKSSRRLQGNFLSATSSLQDKSIGG
jgi:hypothetical protein